MESTNSVILNNIIHLLDTRNINQKELAEYLGLNPQAVTNWKNKTSKSYKKYLPQIASFFNIPIDYLLSDTLDRILQPFAELPPLPSTLRSSMSLSYGDTPEDEQRHVPRANILEMDPNNVCLVPVLESVSAGLGAIAMNDVIDYQPIYFTHPADSWDHICLKVKGDSMYPKIEDGDIILIRKQDSVDTGSLAVVLLDGDEGLVKRIEYGSDWIELHSINPMYKTVRFEGSDVSRIRIVGLVKKIIKSV